MRLVGFDLECSNLSGMAGRILCCSFKPILPDRSGEVYTFRGDDKKYRNKKDMADDSQLAVAIRNELEQYDLLVGHNSKLFDRKFLNARLLHAGERPAPSQWHIDTMWIIRSHIRASSKLALAQNFMGLPEEKTPITWDDWMRGMAFDRAAMDNIVQHCEQDVKVLEQAYWRLLPYVRTISRA